MIVPRDQTLRIHDSRTGAELLVLEIDGTTFADAVFLPEDDFLLSVSEDGIARLWDIGVTASAAGKRASLLAAGLGNGIGVIHGKEREDLLLSDAPTDLFSGVMRLIPDQHKEVNRLMNELRCEADPRCYRVTPPHDICRRDSTTDP